MRIGRMRATYLKMPISTTVLRLFRRELHTRQFDNDLQTAVSELFLQIHLRVLMTEDFCLIAITTPALLR